ncbi:hypothetical protein DVR12_01915 [Chitinophaga silvatica]|uniref:Uncharacterized protein n=1 Tax=Chitinophaga silvatica TaxID=2282649 RepID=A0A3E1YGR2_9BACT|nr:hypothetical protein [Chitinophaga silvatica]RFS26566.1 hypothetical protein DVR12_01915 [Chitinophaga silvatica]
MKKLSLLVCLLSLFCFKSIAQSPNLYERTIVFPPNYAVGDYVQFLSVAPYGAWAGGYYEVSIAYTRGNVAAASTHIVSISHSNPSLWREAGKINSNPYASGGQTSFTVDINTAYTAAALRIRATAVSGVTTDTLRLFVKVRSVGVTSSWTAQNITGNDINPLPLAPMTAEWNLWVGNPFFATAAKVAIKADVNGNVGIGTLNPQSLLSVAGTITAQKVKVTSTGWPDYVFGKDYKLPTLQEVEKHILEHGHLPGVPSEAEVKKNDVDLGQMNEILLKKIEELTLYLLQEKKESSLQFEQLRKENELLRKEVEELKIKQQVHE